MRERAPASEREQQLLVLVVKSKSTCLSNRKRELPLGVSKQRRQHREGYVYTVGKVAGVRLTPRLEGRRTRHSNPRTGTT